MPKREALATPNTRTKYEAFCREYLVDLNAAGAARRAGYSAKSAKQTSVRLMQHPWVTARITELQLERSKRVQITADDVLRMWRDLANADPRELVEYRRTCCRHCYGKDFRYQSTKGERDRAFNAWAATQKKSSPETFDEQGGIGFDAKKAPHPDCPECFGEGHETVYFHDTRTLSAAALILYEGAEITRDGKKMNMASREKAREQIARHLGMFDETRDRDVGDEQRAAKIRAELDAMDRATGGSSESAA